MASKYISPTHSYFSFKFSLSIFNMLVEHFLFAGLSTSKLYKMIKKIQGKLHEQHHEFHHPYASEG